MKRLPEHLVHLIILLGVVMMILSIALSGGEPSYKAVLSFLIVLGLLILNQLFGEIETKEIRLAPLNRSYWYSDVFKDPTLIKYSPTGRYENMIVDIVSTLAGDKPVILVTSPPMTSLYYERFRELIKVGRVRLADITMEKPLPLNRDRVKIQMNELGRLSEIYSKSPENSVVIFEPVSDVILTVGIEHAYKLLSHWLEICSSKNVSFIALLNQKAHEKKAVGIFDSLFLNIAVLSKNRLKKVK